MPPSFAPPELASRVWNLPVSLALIGMALLLTSCQVFQSNTQPRPTAGPSPSPGSGEISVTVDEALLTSQLNQRVAGRPLGQTPIGEVTINDLQADAREGILVITGTARAGGASVPVSVNVAFEVQDARPVASVRKARVGDVPLPEIAQREIEQTIQAELDRAVQRQPLEVRAVHVGNDTVTIVGTPR